MCCSQLASVVMAHHFRHCQLLLESCRRGQESFGALHREVMKRSKRCKKLSSSSPKPAPGHRANEVPVSLPDALNTQRSAPAFKTPIDWASACEELLIALRELPRGPKRRMDTGEARFLYGLASLASASARRFTSPMAVDAAAVSDLWRALANFAMCKSMLTGAKQGLEVGLLKHKKVSKGGRNSHHQHAKDSIERLTKLLKKTKAADKKALKVRVVACGAPTPFRRFCSRNDTVHALLHTTLLICHGLASAVDFAPKIWDSAIRFLDGARVVRDNSGMARLEYGAAAARIRVTRGQRVLTVPLPTWSSHRQPTGSPHS